MTGRRGTPARCGLPSSTWSGCASDRRPILGSAPPAPGTTDARQARTLRTSALGSWRTHPGRSLRREARGMSIRTPPRGPTSVGIVPRVRAVAPPVRRGSGHCMTGAVTASPRRAVEVPGLWTPGRRRAESEGRRGGRSQALGNLAGDRCRPCLRLGPRDSRTPTAIVILAMIQREHEGVTSQPGYTLSKPSNCPNNRDHFNHGRNTRHRLGSADCLPYQLPGRIAETP